MPIVDPHWPRADAWLARGSSDPEIIVVGVPSSSASLSPSRADTTPFALRDRLPRFSTFHGEWEVDFSQLRVHDEGNWAVSHLDMHQMIPSVLELARALPEVPLTLYLGGDNAITRPLVRASGELRATGVITFDAHHDVRTTENGPTNGSPIRGLIEDGLPGTNVVQIGIHSFANSRDYRGYCDQQGISIRTIEDVVRAGMDGIVEAALVYLADKCDQIYVDVDIDVLDRALAPGCPGSRPGGLTVRQLAEGVSRCASHPKVTAMDFVEVDAEADVDGITLDSMAHVFLSAVSGYAQRAT